MEPKLSNVYPDVANDPIWSKLIYALTQKPCNLSDWKAYGVICGIVSGIRNEFLDKKTVSTKCGFGLDSHHWLIVLANVQTRFSDGQLRKAERSLIAVEDAMANLCQKSQTPIEFCNMQFTYIGQKPHLPSPNEKSLLSKLEESFEDEELIKEEPAVVELNKNLFKKAKNQIENRASRPSFKIINLDNKIL